MTNPSGATVYVLYRNWAALDKTCNHGDYYGDEFLDDYLQHNVSVSGTTSASALGAKSGFDLLAMGCPDYPAQAGFLFEWLVSTPLEVEQGSTITIKLDYAPPSACNDWWPWYDIGGVTVVVVEWDAPTADRDNDGIDDDEDNCPDDANANGHGTCTEGRTGEPCEQDGACNDPGETNGVCITDQRDSDYDQIGDACDNCPIDANVDQTDTDNDEKGDACDNCPEAPNAHGHGTCSEGLRGTPCTDRIQCDTSPGQGDGVCSLDQEDSDDDEAGDACDNCPETPNHGSQGTCVTGLTGEQCTESSQCDDPPGQGNGFCSLDQEDADGDGVGDACDLCPNTPGNDDTDTDGDGTPDLCDECPDDDENTCAQSTEIPPFKCPGSAKPEDPCSGCVAGQEKDEKTGADPVYLFSGEYYLSEVDLRIPGRGFDFVWSRKYRSRGGPNTAMGNGWDFSYNVYLEKVNIDPLDPKKYNLRLHDGNSRSDLYTQYGSRWYAPGFFQTISEEGGLLVLQFSDKSKWVFNTGLRLGKTVDRNGNEMSFLYENGHLVQVFDTLHVPGVVSRVIDINYVQIGGIHYVRSVRDWLGDSLGREVVYDYYHGGEPGGSAGDLKSVRTPVVVGMPEVAGTPSRNDSNGKTTYYTYSKGAADQALNHNLLTIKDHKGHVYLQNIYATTTDPKDLTYDRVMRQVWGGPTDLVDIQYVKLTPNTTTTDPDYNAGATIKAIVRNRVGTVAEYFYDANNYSVMTREYTGCAPQRDKPVTDTSNRPVGRLRPSDPNYYQTVQVYQQYIDAYHNDILLKEIRHPNGNITRNVYEVDLNPSATTLERGRIREIHRLQGTHPVPPDQAGLVESFEYDSGCCPQLARTHTDARGKVTEYQRDSKGNVEHIIYPQDSAATLGQKIREDFTYNDYGQVLTHTYPDNGSGHRRVDEFVYYGTDRIHQYGYLWKHIVDSGPGGLNLVTEYDYDVVGNLIKVTAPNGRVTEYLVNQLNQVVRETVKNVDLANGQFKDYQRDSWHDDNGNVTRVEYKDFGSDATNRGSIVTEYDYELLNYLTRVTSRVATSPLKHVVTEYGYDANRNRIQIRQGEATGGDQNWYTEGQQPENTIGMAYDERGLLMRRVIAPLDAAHRMITQYDYDRNGELAWVRVGPPGASRDTQLVYDAFGRLKFSVDAMGNLVENTYDANGNLKNKVVRGELTDVDGNAGNIRLYEAAFDYDDINRPTQSRVKHFKPQDQSDIGDGVSTTTGVYTDSSQVKTVTDDNGRQSAFTYDEAGRLKTVTDAKGNTATYDYNLTERTVTVTEVEKSDVGSADETFVTTKGYDILDRLTWVQNNASHISRSHYDSRGNVERITDNLGNVIRHEYDGLSRPTRTTREMRAGGVGSGALLEEIITRQTWDDSSRLKTRTDANNNTTTYTYDPLDRLIMTSYADDTTETWQYDAYGDLDLRIDPNGTIIDPSAYDLLGRPTQINITPATGVYASTTRQQFAYDGLSRIVDARIGDATTDESQVARSYDSMGGMLSETSLLNITGFALQTAEVSSIYDGVGNRTQVTYPGGRMIDFEPDALNRLSKVNIPGTPPTAIAEYKYFGPGRIEQRSYANNTRVTDSYDNLRRITGTQHIFDPGGANTIIDDRSYAWDAAFNKTQRKDLRSGGPGLTHDYQYDSVYRMSHSTRTPGVGLAEEVVFDLDSVGNRTQVLGGRGAGGYAMSEAPSILDRPMNQYTATPSDRRSYDLSGNLLMTRPRQAEDLDADGDVDSDDFAVFDGCRGQSDVAPEPGCGVADLDGDGDVDLADYGRLQPQVMGAGAGSGSGSSSPHIVYDFRNLMVRYTDPDSGVVTEYRYDPFGRRIAKIADASGTRQVTYFFHDGGRVCEEQDATGATLATYVYGNYVDEVLTMTRGGSDYYFHTDDLYNVVAVTDATGAVVERYEYDTYGRPTILAPDGTTRTSSTIGNPLMFQGRPYDPETGYYWYRTRYYDPRTGRFTSRDTIGIWGDPTNLGNGYTFVGNNPWTLLDPLGLQMMQAMQLEYMRENDRLVWQGRQLPPMTPGEREAVKGVGLAVWDVFKPDPQRALSMLAFPYHIDSQVGTDLATATLETYNEARDYSDMGAADAVFHTGAVGAGHFLGGQYFQAGNEAWEKGDIRGAARNWTRGTIHVVTLAAAACAAKDATIGGTGSSRIQQNARQGAAWERQVKTQVQTTQTNVVEQISVKTQSGVKTRLDLVGQDAATGATKLTEAKSSATAPLTANQAAAFPEIATTGATVVGKGKPPFVGGTPLPPTKVDIVRPE